MFRSSIGAKQMMAVTGVLLFGFVIAHLAGNLQIFLGADAFNRYALELRDFGPLLWVARLVLLAVLCIHLYSAFWLTRKNWRARPERYAIQSFPRSTAASRSMLLSGWLILAFLVFHLAHYTFFVMNPDFAKMEWRFADGRLGHDVYNMAVKGFSQPWIVGLYVVAQIFLAMHLNHALGSIFQTFGLKTQNNERIVDWIGPAASSLIMAGYVSIPIAILIGLVGLETPRS